VRTLLEDHTLVVICGLHGGTQQLVDLVPVDTVVSRTCWSFMYCHE
jgi:hypothetical protein